MTCEGCGDKTKFGTFLWRPVAQEERVASVLEEMLGTPYMENQRARGIGFDCRTAIGYFLDEMRGTSTPLPSVPSDAAANQPELALAVLRKLVRDFDLNEVLEERILEPGDIIGARGRGTIGPAHGYIVGAKRYTLYHSPREKTPFSRTVLTPDLEVVSVYRAPKESWS